MSIRRQKILVVDDDHDLLEMLAILLRGAGFEVVTAGDGSEALRCVEAEMPRLILLDMKMPVMNGWDFAREYRRRFNDGAPVIVLTAAENARKRAAEIDATDYLGKPFDIHRLLRMVRKYTSAK